MCDSVTRNNLHSTYCTSFYGIELYNFNEDYIDDVYIAWRKCIRLIYRLPYQAHNFIVSNLDYCIIERLDRRLAKYIYNLLHSPNIMLKSIITSKLLLCPRSIVSENYKYLQYKATQATQIGMLVLAIYWVGYTMYLAEIIYLLLILCTNYVSSETVSSFVIQWILTLVIFKQLLTLFVPISNSMLSIVYTCIQFSIAICYIMLKNVYMFCTNKDLNINIYNR